MDNLKELRKKKGLTQAELANIVGVSDVTINRYELGLRTPKIDNILKIANALEVNPQLFLNFKSGEIFDDDLTVTLSKGEYAHLKEIEKKYNQIKELMK